MKRRGLLLTAACLAGLAATASAQGLREPRGYGGFGGEYIQAPSLYYPFPGMIESRFGTYFSAPVVPPLGVESPVEAASIEAANAARAGVPPAVKARADADARAAEAGADAPKAAARNNRRGARSNIRNANNPPAPYRRAMPRGNIEALNDLPAGAPAYTPYARYQTYGQAYGMGPYGSNYYSGWWKGYTPMHIFTGPEGPIP